MTDLDRAAILPQLRAIAAARFAGRRDDAGERALARWSPEHHLAVYGTLAPGESNHDQLARLRGDWLRARVHGHRAVRRFPVFTWDENAPAIEVQLFVSTDLPLHWARLDAFEGPDYCRILVPVTRSDGTLAVANVYAAVGPVSSSGGHRP